MFVMLTNNRWKKDEYSQKCFEDLIKDAHFPTSGTLGIYYIDCTFKEVTVDDMGTINYPKGAKLRKWLLELEDYSKLINKWRDADEQLEGIKEDIWYEEFYDKAIELEDA